MQVLLPLAGRFKDSKEEENRKGDTIGKAARLAEGAGKFPSRLILVANVCEKRILAFGALGPDAKSAPRALHKAVGLAIIGIKIIGKRFS